MQYKVVGDENGVRNIAGEIYKDGQIVSLPEAVGVSALEQGFVEPVETEVEATEEKSEEAETKVETEEAKKNEPKFHYFITNKESGEKFAVLAHTFGDGFVDFAKEGLTPEEWTSPDVELFRFQNPEDKGELSSEFWDIEKHEWDGSETHVD